MALADLFPSLPIWLTDEPQLPDVPDTESSELQQETAEECLPFLLNLRQSGRSVDDVNEHGVAHLNRSKHVKFLQNWLGRLPAGFAALDASRPWMLYWCLTGLSVLGENVERYRESVVSTFRTIQNPSGGFGGGNGQYSHLATTYATILSLVMVGGQDAYDLVDREAMWHWLGRLKQPEGDFAVSEGGERDVRGSFSAVVVISLLNLPMDLPSTSPARKFGHDTFASGLPEWISKCQTYEGGMSSEPGSEAHGAYTFCALGTLCILGEPSRTMNRYLNMPSLVSWLANRQHAPEGGLAGRSNKLVDGCYSHWIGGCWSLVEAAVAEPAAPAPSSDAQVSALWNRDGLIRYILCCCQGDRGGLRDKPSKSPDAYHTCYNLAGLSSAQNQYDYTPPDCGVTLSPLTAAFHWTAKKRQISFDGISEQIFDEKDRAEFIHPVYVVSWGAAERARAYFEQKVDTFHL